MSVGQGADNEVWLWVRGEERSRKVVVTMTGRGDGGSEEKREER